MSSKPPFPPDQVGSPTDRQLAIAALIQHIWDGVSRTGDRDADGCDHGNWGVPQSKLPPVDRWANAFSAIVLDQWIDAFSARSGSPGTLGRGSRGEHRAARVLFMLWSIARFGTEAAPAATRRFPTSIQDIPARHMGQIRQWWELSLESISNTEVDRQFEDHFPATFHQVLLDRCIARAAIACQSLPEHDLRAIADEQDIEQWADRLADLGATLRILERQRTSRACPTIMIVGPTSTGKSAVAWELARRLGAVVIAADPFQICAVPPIALGVGLPVHLPPEDLHTRLYRSRIPGSQRPGAEVVADWVVSAVGDEECQRRPKVIEGGSISAAAALCRRGIPTHSVVFAAELPTAAARIRARVSADGMNAETMLREARAVRAAGYDSTWVVRESIIYPRLLQALDRQMSREEMMCHIQHDWQQLVADQQEWFGELLVRDDVAALPPSRQTVEGVMKLVGLG